MGRTTSNPYDGSNYKVNYSLPTVTAGTSIIGSSIFTSLVGTVNAERQRRGNQSTAIATPQSVPNHNDWNNIANALTGITGLTLTTTHSGSAPSYSNQSPPTASPFAATAKNAKIYASDLNNLITALVNAGQVCMCDCNYCTCNCNYCTCNCDYSCTCNCNYSDARLKTDIRYLRTENDIKIYSFRYLWDDKTLYEGAMAQDLVNSKYSNSVSRDDRGYFVVDYSKLPIKMQEVAHV
jgi:hypothetical protein